MQILILLISIWIFIRALSYGLYEIKQNSNTIGGVTTIVIAALALISPNLILFINGLYQ